MRDSYARETLAYLCAAQLNLNSSPLAGKESNLRLRGLFMSLVETIRPSIFFDVGARDGESAIEVKHAVPECRAIAFEANPNIHQQFASMNDELGLIEYHNLALSDTVGSVPLHVPRVTTEVMIGDEIVAMEHVETDDTGRSSLLKRIDPGAVYDSVDVTTSTLDAFCRQERLTRAAPTAIWIDVEGAANLVIAGARRALRNAAVLFIEVEGHAFWDSQSRSHTVIADLISRGFVPVARDREYYDKQFNVLLVRSDYLHLVVPHLYDRKTEFVRTGSVSGEITELADRVSALERQDDPDVRRTVMSNLAPVIIPTFNNPTYLRGMVEQLSGCGLINLIIVDNASTFRPMLDYLGELSDTHRVRMMTDNAGPRRTWEDREFFDSLPNVFCVTDPDLRLNPALPRNFTDRLFELTTKYGIGKVGFALDISDRTMLRDEEFTIGGNQYQIWEWESQFWQDEVEPNVFRASIDTTFALYNKNHFDVNAPISALRVAGDYTCQHLPWLKAATLPNDETDFYRETNIHSFYLPNAVVGAPQK